MMQNSQEQKRMPLIENRTLCLTILLMALVYNVIFGCVRNPPLNQGLDNMNAYPYC